MKKVKFHVLTVIALVVAVVGLSTGCVTSKQTVTKPDGTTTTVTVVNTNNLVLDTAVLQAATAVSVSFVVNNPKNANVIPLLKNVQVALDGILNGSNPQTVQEAIALLKASGNQALVAEVTSLIQTVSALEQQLLVKYGAEVSGQIVIAVTRAVDAGLVIGLQGH